jgi:prophage regulatory protein
MYMTAKQVAERFGVHLTTIWRWRQNGDFPKPIPFGPQTVRWRVTDVEAWEAAQAA